MVAPKVSRTARSAPAAVAAPSHGGTRPRAARSSRWRETRRAMATPPSGGGATDTTALTPARRRVGWCQAAERSPTRTFGKGRASEDDDIRAPMAEHCTGRRGSASRRGAAEQGAGEEGGIRAGAPCSPHTPWQAAARCGARSAQDGTGECSAHVQASELRQLLHLRRQIREFVTRQRAARHPQAPVGQRSRRVDGAQAVVLEGEPAQLRQSVERVGPRGDPVGAQVEVGQQRHRSARRSAEVAQPVPAEVQPAQLRQAGLVEHERLVQLIVLGLKLCQAAELG
eukprot:scaffold16219_cov102-Isochrysis_galbana.AAC.25